MRRLHQWRILRTTGAHARSAPASISGWFGGFNDGERAHPERQREPSFVVDVDQRIEEVPPAMRKASAATTAAVVRRTLRHRDAPPGRERSQTSFPGQVEQRPRAGVTSSKRTAARTAARCRAAPEPSAGSAYRSAPASGTPSPAPPAAHGRSDLHTGGSPPIAKKEPRCGPDRCSAPQLPAGRASSSCTVTDDWEPAVAADPYAPWVYVVTTRYGAPNACQCHCPSPLIVLARSNDGGRTWRPTKPLCICRCVGSAGRPTRSSRSSATPATSTRCGWTRLQHRLLAIRRSRPHLDGAGLDEGKRRRGTTSRRSP